MDEVQDESDKLFVKLVELTVDLDVKDTIPALSGILVREMASSVGLFGAPPEMVDRVLKIIATDVHDAVVQWQQQRRH